MKSIVLIIAGAIIGFMSATMAISERAASSVEVRDGIWQDIANNADANIDPYLRASYAALGWLLPAQGEDQLLEATTDSNGSAFDADCRYLVSGKTPQVRWWQIAIVDNDGEGADTDPRARPDAISSEAIIAEADGRFRLNISRRPVSGNWISPGKRDDFSLVMTLRREDPAMAGDVEPPAVARVSCD
ncbi:MAG: DUF1214 domain-containing protein [Rhizobiales bacterium]|nr:DUF1214 domain-containing protein [Hyphomicrobiales bacterium]